MRLTKRTETSYRLADCSKDCIRICNDCDLIKRAIRRLGELEDMDTDFLRKAVISKINGIYGGCFTARYKCTFVLRITLPYSVHLVLLTYQIPFVRHTEGRKEK